MGIDILCDSGPEHRDKPKRLSLCHSVTLTGEPEKQCPLGPCCTRVQLH